MVAEVETGKQTHPAFAVEVEDLRRALRKSTLSQDLLTTVALIPFVPRPDASSVLAQVCTHLDVSPRWIRCKTRPDGEQGQISSYIVFKRIERADRLILEEGTLKVIGHHSQWPEYLEIHLETEDGMGVKAGVLAVLVAIALWRCEHRLIVNRCAGD